MNRIALIVAGALLALPAVAQAKGGVEFESAPDTAKPGEKVAFTVMTMRDPPSFDGTPTPIAGRHPLVTFRSRSGRVVRVRAGETDRSGIAHGQVIFPDTGPWTTELRVGKELQIGPEQSEPIRVGVGLTQTIPAADAARPKTAAPDASGFPWVWVLSLGAIGSALLVLLMRRRGHWGAA